MKFFSMFLLVGLLSCTHAIAMDAKITTIDRETTHNLKDLELQCDGKNYGSSLSVLQNGAQVEIPLKAISLMRTLQNNNGFYIKTTTGQELTNCQIPCTNYKWVGKNDFGGETSIDGKKWQLVKMIQ